MDLKNSIIDLVFPQGTYCVICGKYIDKTRTYGLCDHCIEHMNFDCREIIGSQFFDYGFSAMGYGAYERRLVFNLKYDGHTYMARIIADIIYDALMQQLRNETNIVDRQCRNLPNFVEQQPSKPSPFAEQQPSNPSHSDEQRPSKRQSVAKQTSKHLSSVERQSPKWQSADKQLPKHQLLDNTHSVLDILNADIIIPVPIHKRRLSQRGFNQTEKIAKHLGKKLGIPVDSKSLIRIKETSAQRALSAQERAVNIDGAFVVRGWHATCEPQASNRKHATCEPQASNKRHAISEPQAKMSPQPESQQQSEPQQQSQPRSQSKLPPQLQDSKPSPVSGKTIILLDDIYTTGATLNACAKVLKQAGAKKICVLTLLSAGNRHHLMVK